MNVDWNQIVKPDWTLFLDRDGVINERIIGGYVQNTEQFRFLDGVLEAMTVFARRFRRIVLITNQQGIGKGLMTVTQLSEIHAMMKTEIERNGGRVDAIFACPQLASDPDNYRKPNPRMAQMACERFSEIDLSKTIMVGDGHLDMEFGRNAGTYNVFIGSADELADDCFGNLYDFSIVLAK